MGDRIVFHKKEAAWIQGFLGPDAGSFFAEKQIFYLSGKKERGNLKERGGNNPGYGTLGKSQESRGAKTSSFFPVSGESRCAGGIEQHENKKAHS